MKNPFNFEYYINKKIVIKKSSDVSRAEFLINESKKSYKGLRKRIKVMGIDELNSNSIIKDIHDILIQSIRSQMILKGFYASGNYAHEAEVSFMKTLNFTDTEINFVNVLRASRNGINYYGKIYEENYAKECYNFLKKHHKKFKLNM